MSKNTEPKIRDSYTLQVAAKKLGLKYDTLLKRVREDTKKEPQHREYIAFQVGKRWYVNKYFVDYHNMDPVGLFQSLCIGAANYIDTRGGLETLLPVLRDPKFFEMAVDVYHQHQELRDWDPTIEEKLKLRKLLGDDAVAKKEPPEP